MHHKFTSHRHLPTPQGCTTFTFSPTIAAKLFNNPYTIDAADEFERAAKSNGADEDLARVLVRSGGDSLQHPVTCYNSTRQPV